MAFLRLAANGVACDLGLHAGQNIVKGRDAIDHALRQGSISAKHTAFAHAVSDNVDRDTCPRPQPG